MHLVDDGGIDVLLRHVLLYALRVSPSGILQELGHRHRSAWLVNSSCQCAFEAIRLLFRSVDVGNSAGQHPQQGRAYYQDTSQPDGTSKTWIKTGFPCLLQLAHGARSHKLVLRHAPGPAAAHQPVLSTCHHQLVVTSVPRLPPPRLPALPALRHRGFFNLHHAVLLLVSLGNSQPSHRFLAARCLLLLALCPHNFPPWILRGGSCHGVIKGDGRQDVVLIARPPWLLGGAIRPL